MATPIRMLNQQADKTAAEELALIEQYFATYGSKLTSAQRWFILASLTKAFIAGVQHASKEETQ